MNYQTITCQKGQYAGYLINNGNTWATFIHDEEMIQGSIKSETLFQMCKEIAYKANGGKIPPFIFSDDFLEDIIYSLTDMGYTINC